ncbi:hypothetical protein [Planctomonas psychrotolerans]|uniref:hypothetical protein n=1 Tax=Planctomonas psychrotolerans TaxID=2528712 RepID=UPI00123982BB|nr:hypothetical protein [Planctomonas psychrotolerans]
MSDLVSFRPPVANAVMEPNGWTVVGLDTNFHATVAPPRILTGDLLGQTAEVRFTAALFHWDYGDGATASLPNPGARWDALGLPEFSPTDTSHVYDAPGNIRVTLSVEYVADYRFAGAEWQRVAGSLQVPGELLTVSASRASTVLVGRDCDESPPGPGC